LVIIKKLQYDARPTKCQDRIVGSNTTRGLREIYWFALNLYIYV